MSYWGSLVKPFRHSSGLSPVVKKKNCFVCIGETSIMRPVNQYLAPLAEVHARLSLQATLTAVTDMCGNGSPSGNLHPKDIFKGVRPLLAFSATSPHSHEFLFCPLYFSSSQEQTHRVTLKDIFLYQSRFEKMDCKVLNLYSIQ